MTSIPATRSWLMGVANVRGNLIALVDLKQFLFEQRTHVTGRARVLVVKQAGGNVGLLVDELIGQRNLTDADRAGAEGEADPALARFVTENSTWARSGWGGSAWWSWRVRRGSSTRRFSFAISMIAVSWGALGYRRGCRR